MIKNMLNMFFIVLIVKIINYLINLYTNIYKLLSPILVSFNLLFHILDLFFTYKKTTYVAYLFKMLKISKVKTNNNFFNKQ